MQHPHCAGTRYAHRIPLLPAEKVIQMGRMDISVAGFSFLKKGPAKEMLLEYLCPLNGVQPEVQGSKIETGERETQGGETHGIGAGTAQIRESCTL